MDNNHQDTLEDISRIEMENNDGVMKTKVTINTVNGRTYTIVSAVLRRVLTVTLMKRIASKLPIVFPIPSNDARKVADFIIPADLIQDVLVEDHSHLEVAQRPQLRK